MPENYQQIVDGLLSDNIEGGNEQDAISNKPNYEEIVRELIAPDAVATTIPDGTVVDYEKIVNDLIGKQATSPATKTRQLAENKAIYEREQAGAPVTFDVVDRATGETRTVPFQITNTDEERSFTQNLKESFSRGNEDIWRNVFDALGAVGTVGGEDNPIFAKANEYRQLQEQGDSVKADNWLSQQFHTVANMTPGLMAGAGLNFIAPGSGIGFWTLQGAGDMYRNLRADGVGKKTALSISVPMGIIYGKLESMQAGQAGLTKPFKDTLFKSLRKITDEGWKRILAKYGINVIKEAGEEGLQQITQELANYIGKAANDMTNDTNYMQTEFNTKNYGESAENVANAFFQSLVPSAILSVPGHAYNGKKLIDRLNRKSKYQANKPPVVPVSALKPDTSIHVEDDGTAVTVGEDGIKTPIVNDTTGEPIVSSPKTPLAVALRHAGAYSEDDAIQFKDSVVTKWGELTDSQGNPLPEPTPETVDQFIADNYKNIWYVRHLNEISKNQGNNGQPWKLSDIIAKIVHNTGLAMDISDRYDIVRGEFANKIDEMDTDTLVSEYGKLVDTVRANNDQATPEQREQMTYMADNIKVRKDIDAIRELQKIQQPELPEGEAVQGRIVPPTEPITGTNEQKVPIVGPTQEELPVGEEATKLPIEKVEPAKSTKAEKVVVVSPTQAELPVQSKLPKIPRENNLTLVNRETRKAQEDFLGKTLYGHAVSAEWGEVATNDRLDAWQRTKNIRDKDKRLARRKKLMKGVDTLVGGTPWEDELTHPEDILNAMVSERQGYRNIRKELATERQVKREEDKEREVFEKEVAQERTGTETGEVSFEPEQIEKVTTRKKKIDTTYKKLKKALPFLPEHVSVEDKSELPEEIQDKMDDDVPFSATKETIEAFYYDGKVYTIAKDIPEDRVFKVLLHEIIGHYGMIQVFGEKMEAELGKLYRNNSAYKALVDGEQARLGIPHSEALEEGLAKFVEGGKLPTGFMVNVRKIIADFLEAVGLGEYAQDLRVKDMYLLFEGNKQLADLANVAMRGMTGVQDTGVEGLRFSRTTPASKPTLEQRIEAIIIDGINEYNRKNAPSMSHVAEKTASDGSKVRTLSQRYVDLGKVTGEDIGKISKYNPESMETTQVKAVQAIDDNGGLQATAEMSIDRNPKLEPAVASAVLFNMIHYLRHKMSQAPASEQKNYLEDINYYIDHAATLATQYGQAVNEQKAFNLKITDAPSAEFFVDRENAKTRKEFVEKKREYISAVEDVIAEDKGDHVPDATEIAEKAFLKALADKRAKLGKGQKLKFSRIISNNISKGEYDETRDMEQVGANQEDVAGASAGVIGQGIQGRDISANRRSRGEQSLRQRSSARWERQLDGIRAEANREGASETDKQKDLRFSKSVEPEFPFAKDTFNLSQEEDNAPVKTFEELEAERFEKARIAAEQGTPELPFEKLQEDEKGERLLFSKSSDRENAVAVTARQLISDGDPDTKSKLANQYPEMSETRINKIYMKALTDVVALNELSPEEILKENGTDRRAVADAIAEQKPAKKPKKIKNKEEFVTESMKRIKRIFRQRTIENPKQLKNAILAIGEKHLKGDIKAGDIEEIFVKQFKIPQIDDATKKELAKIAGDLSKLPPDTVDYKNMQAELYQSVREAMGKGITTDDIATNLFYSFMLSRTSTQLVNFGNTGINTLMESFMGILNQNPATMVKNLQALWKLNEEGFVKGRSEAVHHLKTGKNIVREAEKKFEAPNIGANMFKGAFAFLNNIKYVTRLMIASDTYWFKGAEGIKARLIAVEMANEALRKGEIAPQDFWNYANEIIFASDTQLRIAKDQAVEEFRIAKDVIFQKRDKLTGKPTGKVYEGEQAKKVRENWIKRRVWEIQELQRNRAGNGAFGERVKEFGLGSTLNGEPDGLIGTIAHMLGEITSFDIPRDASKPVKGAMIATRLTLKSIVPFTRILGNIMNLNLDYVGRGFILYPAQTKTVWRRGQGLVSEPISQDLKTQRLKRSILGFSMMSALYLLAIANKRDDGTDEWDEGFEIYGSMADDPEGKKKLASLGGYPYSVRIGNKFFPFSSILPMSSVFALIGGIRDKQRVGKWKDADWKERVAMPMVDAARMATTVSFLKSTYDFLDIFHGTQKEAERKAGAFAARATTNVIPGIAKETSGWFMDNKPERKTLQANFESQVPYLMWYAKPALDYFGEPLKNNRMGWLISDAGPNMKYFQLASHNKAVLTKAGTPEVNGQKLDGEDSYEYGKKAGQYTKKMIDAMGFDTFDGLKKDEWSAGDRELLVDEDGNIIPSEKTTNRADLLMGGMLRMARQQAQYDFGEKLKTQNEVRLRPEEFDKFVSVYSTIVKKNLLKFEARVTRLESQGKMMPQQTKELYQDMLAASKAEAMQQMWKMKTTEDRKTYKAWLKQVNEEAKRPRKPMR